jgi:hypothetical protein
MIPSGYFFTCFIKAEVFVLEERRRAGETDAVIALRLYLRRRSLFSAVDLCILTY